MTRLIDITKAAAFAAALTIAWGCSSNDDDSDNGTVFTASFSAVDSAPEWNVDLSSNIEQPQWTRPNPADYENNMVFVVRLQDELVAYSTDSDLMSVFINGSCRAISNRVAHGDRVYFVLNVHGNSNADNVEFNLQYYSGGLRELFSISGQGSFVNEFNYGVDKDFIPDIISGSTSFPVLTELTVTIPEAQAAPFEPFEGDRVAAFVDGQCRGTGVPGKPFYVFADKQSQSFQLRYYSVTRQGVYTAASPVVLNGEPTLLLFHF